MAEIVIIWCGYCQWKERHEVLNGGKARRCLRCGKVTEQK